MQQVRWSVLQMLSQQPQSDPGFPYLAKNYHVMVILLSSQTVFLMYLFEVLTQFKWPGFEP